MFSIPSTFTTVLLQLGCLSIYLVSFKFSSFHSEKEAKYWILFPKENVCSVMKNENRWHCKALGRSIALQFKLLGKVRDKHIATNCCSYLYDLIQVCKTKSVQGRILLLILNKRIFLIYSPDFTKWMLKQPGFIRKKE